MSKKIFGIHDYFVESYVDIELDEDDLRESGWIPADEAIDSIAPVVDWHNDEHEGAFAWCQKRPCWDINHFQ